jgi:iodotyrosine deiodinase
VSAPLDQSKTTDTRAPIEDIASRVISYYEQVKTRRSARKFSSQPIPKEAIEAAICAANTAPSAANQQPWHFVYISDPEIKQKIRHAAEVDENPLYGRNAGDAWLHDQTPLGNAEDKAFFEDAPWVIAVFYEWNDSTKERSRLEKHYTAESAGIATGFLINAFHAAGLSTLVHTASPAKQLNSLLNRPSSEHPLLLLVVGYALEDYERSEPKRPKKTMAEISSYFAARRKF